MTMMNIRRILSVTAVMVWVQGCMGMDQNRPLPALQKLLAETGSMPIEAPKSLKCPTCEHDLKEMRIFELVAELKQQRSDDQDADLFCQSPNRPLASDAPWRLYLWKNRISGEPEYNRFEISCNLCDEGMPDDEESIKKHGPRYRSVIGRGEKEVLDLDQARGGGEAPGTDHGRKDGTERENDDTSQVIVYHCGNCCYDLCKNCAAKSSQAHPGLGAPVEVQQPMKKADLYCEEKSDIESSQAHPEPPCCCDSEDQIQNGLKQFLQSDNRYSCDECHKYVSNGSILYGCRVCNYDVCSDCRQVEVQSLIKKRIFQAHPERNCLERHGLKPFLQSDNRYKCNICSNKVSNGSIIYACRECNYDVCSECWQGKPEKEKLPVKVQTHNAKSAKSMTKASMEAFKMKCVEDKCWDVMTCDGCKKYFTDVVKDGASLLVWSCYSCCNQDLCYKCCLN
jgi:hypothetical protein